jgi:ribonucleoside-diphosphate reductase alpha chain
MTQLTISPHPYAGEKPLPTRRAILTTKARVGGQTVHFSIGFFPDGSPCEVFIDCHKQGTALRAWTTAAAILLSKLLQCGVPIREVVATLRDMATETEPIVRVEGVPGVEKCSGILDMLGQVLEQWDDREE